MQSKTSRNEQRLALSGLLSNLSVGTIGAAVFVPLPQGGSLIEIALRCLYFSLALVLAALSQMALGAMED